MAKKDTTPKRGGFLTKRRIDELNDDAPADAPIIRDTIFDPGADNAPAPKYAGGPLAWWDADSTDEGEFAETPEKPDSQPAKEDGDEPDGS